MAGEESAWSVVYRLRLPSGDALFLKGVPRTRAEAGVSARLAALCPEAVAPVLAVDLIPDDTWCWFVLGDAGRDGGESLDPSIAIRAAACQGSRRSPWHRCGGSRRRAPATRRWSATWPIVGPMEPRRRPGASRGPSRGGSASCGCGESPRKRHGPWTPWTSWPGGATTDGRRPPSARRSQTCGPSTTGSWTGRSRRGATPGRGSRGRASRCACRACSPRRR